MWHSLVRKEAFYHFPSVAEWEDWKYIAQPLSDDKLIWKIFLTRSTNIEAIFHCSKTILAICMHIFMCSRLFYIIVRLLIFSLSILSEWKHRQLPFNLMFPMYDWSCKWQIQIITNFFLRRISPTILVLCFFN